MAKEEQRRKRALAEADCEQKINESFFESSSSSSDSACNEWVPKVPASKKPKRVSNVVTPEVAAALDRTGTSSRSATYILSAAYCSFGSDPSEFNINRSSIHRERVKFRSKRFDQIKSSLIGEGPLTVHWDGKMIEDLTSTEFVDRLPVLISNGEDEHWLVKNKNDQYSVTIKRSLV